MSAAAAPCIHSLHSRGSVRCGPGTAGTFLSRRYNVEVRGIVPKVLSEAAAARELEKKKQQCVEIAAFIVTTFCNHIL